MLGVGELSGVIGKQFYQEFYEAFVFSTQTLIPGLGRISPMGFWSGLAAAIESLAGAAGFCVGDGLVLRPFFALQADVS